MSCGTITRGSQIAECDDLPEGGTRARLILINYADVDRYLEEDGKIIDIILFAGKFGYEFTGFRNDVKKSEEAIKRETSKTRFVHAVGFVVYEVEQVQKTNVENIAKGRFVAIVENRGKDDDSIEVLGRDCGLEIVAGQIRNAHENGGLFVLNLTTPDNGVEYERRLPQTLGTSYTDGLEIIEDLLEEAEGVFDETFDLTFN